jgi:CBS domain-containing protein
MAASDSHVLPVMKKGQVQGIVHGDDIMKEIAREYSKITCEEFANAPITAKPEDDLFKALTTLSREGIDHLPIVDAQNRLMGMVAASDLIENPNIWNMSAQKLPQAASHQKGKRTGYAHGEKTKMSSLPVKNCMSRRPMCCATPETKIPDAVNRMLDNDVCSIVIIKYDKPVGVFTFKDILIDYAK